jgi:hypothetical protein
MKNLILMAAIGVLAGCVSTTARLKNLASGAVPCTPEAIEIVEGSIVTELTAWRYLAKCNNQTYICRSENSTQCSKKE